MLGQITRTSHSRVFDRVVRVDRRLKTRDHVGGTYPEYQTIIQRYWVRLWPDHQQPEGREELGEVVTSPVFFNALADPTHNGKSIMKGDRFIDEKNNRCYDVQAAVHPRGKFSYSQMIQFRLQRVDDCPQLRVPEGYPEVVIPADGGGGGPTQTHFILRALGGDQIFGWESLPYFDAVYYNLLADSPEQIAELQALVAAGRGYFRYFSIMDYPYSATLFGGTTPPLATWFNYLRDNYQFTLGASFRRLRVGNLVGLLYAYPVSGERREYIPWKDIDAGQREAIAEQIVALARSPGGVDIPCRGIFLDQSWLIMEPFMYPDVTETSGHGETQESQPGFGDLSFASADLNFGTPASSWLNHQESLEDFYVRVDAKLATTGAYAIRNGEHREQNGRTMAKPWFFENAWAAPIDVPLGGWEFVKTEFLTDPRNVINILCDNTPNELNGVPEALDHWEANGGWISFKSPNDELTTNVELAYAEAAARLAALGFPA